MHEVKNSNLKQHCNGPTFQGTDTGSMRVSSPLEDDGLLQDKGNRDLPLQHDTQVTMSSTTPDKSRARINRRKDLDGIEYKHIRD